MAVGIVVVSHSRALAEAAVGLAREMAGASPPSIAIAAGAGDAEDGTAIIGTDATAVMSAIEEADSGDGVIVLMDLGSAVLSAAMALEFLGEREDVRLSDAPFVEGLVASVVLASAGASLDEVLREAGAALAAKRANLPDAPGQPPTETPSAAEQDASSPGSAEVELPNRDGLHARPAAEIVKAVAAFDAAATIENVSKGRGPVPAGSLMGIMSLGAVQGDTVRFAATGADADGVVAQLVRMAREGFGELG